MTDRDVGAIGGGISGFAGITFDDSSGLVVQAPTVSVKPTLIEDPRRELPIDEEQMLAEIRILRDKIRSIPDEYLKRAGLTETEIADIRNQAVTGHLYYDWFDISRIEGKISTAEQLMKLESAGARESVSDILISFIPSTSTSQASWASFREYEAKTTPQYADKEARDLLIQRAWNLPLFNRLIDAGLTLIDLAKIRDNEQMTWKEYYEVEKRIAEAERKVGVDPSDAIRKAQNAMEAGSVVVEDNIGEVATQVCKDVLLESFYGQCETVPYKSGTTYVFISVPQKNVKISFKMNSILESFNGVAKVNMYYNTCDKSKIRIEIVKNDGKVLLNTVLKEQDITIEKAQASIAGDSFKGSDWWLYLLVGAGILVLVIFLTKG